MKKVRDIGYQAVQISAVGPIPEPTLKKICDDNGLTICATHEKSEIIVDDIQKVIDRLAALDCKYTAYPSPRGPLDTAADVAALAAKLQKSGEAMAAAGQYLTYHNHDIEFRKVEGKTILERIYDGTTPEALGGEIDTYWVQAGGGDCLEWIEKLNGRLPLMHLKDYGVKADPRGPLMAPIGSGNMNFKKICAAAEAAGTEWFIVEQDRDWEDPFEAAAESFNYIKEELCI